MIAGDGGRLARNHREVMAEIASELAQKGVTAYSYKRNGTAVNAPVDVGIRRAIANAGNQRRIERTLSVCEQGFPGTSA